MCNCYRCSKIKCHKCDDDKELATTERSAYEPEKYKNEIIPCPECTEKGSK